MANASRDPRPQMTTPILPGGPAAEAAFRAANGVPVPSRVQPINAGDQRRRDIEALAYFRAQRRGFAPGHELDDWLGAELDVDRARHPR